MCRMLIPILATLPILTYANGPSGYATVDVVDLVKSSAANCTFVGSSIIRCAGPIEINALERTSVVGHGSRIEFLDARPGRGGLRLNNANQVNLSDIEIGWLGGGARDPIIPGTPRIQSFGKVSACVAGGPGGMLVLDQPLEGVMPLGAVSVWDDTKGWPWYQSAPTKQFERYFPAGSEARFSGGRSDCINRLSALVGRRVLVRHEVYSANAFVCTGCTNVTIERVRVTSAPGLAFVFRGGGTHIVLRKNIVEPKCWPNCSMPEPSVAAGASHLSGLGGDITIEYNDFGWQGDDGVNINGLMIPARAEAAAGSGDSWRVVDDKFKPRLTFLSAGNEVKLFDHGLNSLGSANVLGVDAQAGTIRLSHMPNITAEVVIVRADEIPTDVVVRGNEFHDNRARAIVMGGSNAIVADNVIERVSMAAILVPADTGPTYEGPGAEHVKITGNRISDVNHCDSPKYPSAISAGVVTAEGFTGRIGSPITDVEVDGNSFVRVYSNAGEPVHFGDGVSNGQMHSNLNK